MKYFFIEKKNIQTALHFLFLSFLIVIFLPSFLPTFLQLFIYQIKMKVPFTPPSPTSYQSTRIIVIPSQQQQQERRNDTPLEHPPRAQRYATGVRVLFLLLLMMCCCCFAAWTIASSTATNHTSSAKKESSTTKGVPLWQQSSPHHSHHSHHHNRHKETNDKKQETAVTPPHHLSSRAINPPPRDDMLIFLDAKWNEYHPDTQPDGKLILLVAENRLMYPELSHQLQHVLQNHTIIPEWVWDYNDMRGHVDFVRSLAHMMESSWMNGIPVRPDSLVVASGAGAMLDALSWTLAEVHQGVLVTGPMYAAFPGDFGIHGGLHVEIVPTVAAANYEPTVQDLERAYEASHAAGRVPRILLICQPHNPTGAVYSRKAMHNMITWALTKPDVHVVSDEIYGNSVFPGTHVTSAAEIMWDLRNNNDTHSFLGDRVHVVAGLSKDWGASGMRVGTLMTHNAALYETMGTLSYYNGVSQLTQWAFTLLLQDVAWRDWYVAENQKRLYATFLAAKAALALIDVPVFEQTQGTLFAWADFSAYLRPHQTERELWMELYEQASVLFTLGESFHGEKPGMFRIVHTWPHGGVEAMHEMGRRLVAWKNNRDH